ncbi:MAG: hypothetical protein ACD_79C01080G0005 [uncultured bacterium]|nr:MAG: hypothetical protein ACD_79C01080G0005 [uncultured bacterium]
MPEKRLIIIMKSLFIKKSFLVCFLFFLILPLLNLYSLEGILDDFKMPLISKDFEEIGTITGIKAVFVDSNTISINKADASFLIKDMNRTWNLQTDSCVFETQNKKIRSDEYVKINSNGIFIDGYGLDWDLSQNLLTVNKNVTVDIEKDSLKAGVPG